MSERLSLDSYERNVAVLSNEQALPMDALARHIAELKEILREAQAAKIGRQVEMVLSILPHYLFEEAARTDGDFGSIRATMEYYRSGGEAVDKSPVYSKLPVTS